MFTQTQELLSPCEDMMPVCDTCTPDRHFCGVKMRLDRVTLGDADFLTKAANVTHLSLARRHVVRTIAGYSASFSVMHNLTCLSLDSWRLTNKEPSRISSSYSRTQLVQFLLSIPTLRQLSAENCELTGKEVVLSDNNNTAIEKLSLS
jgi:hypothetical protein